ncbi:MAG: hypothetical protein ABID87_02030 [Chloroflexota bacterium]
MQISETMMNVLLGVLILGLLVVNFFVRKRKSDKAPIGMAVGVYVEVSKNLKMIDNGTLHWNSGGLRVKNWQRNHDKLSFLPSDILDNLAAANRVVEEVNQQLEYARRYKSDSYLQGIDFKRLKAPLEKVQQPLLEWIQENLRNPAYQPKRRGLFG